MQKFACVFLVLFLYSTSYAGTYSRITVPTKTKPYCEFMPFWYDGDEEKFSELRHPITVNKPVTITVTSPKHLKTDWFGLNPLTGLNIIYKNTIIEPVRLSDTKYQYILKTLPKGDIYAFVGKLKHPSQGLTICVK